MSQAKRELLRAVKPEVGIKKAPKKRKAADDEDQDFEQVVDVFEHEAELKEYYNEAGRIEISEVEEIPEETMYIAIDTKDLMNQLDLKKEIVLTMLNQLEKVEGSFFRVDSVLPAFLGIRFHKAPIEELAEESKLFAAILSLCPKPHMGVHRVQTIKLAQKMGLKPYNIPRILYQV